MNEILKIKHGLEENKWRKLLSPFIDILYQEILGHTQARWESTKLLIASVTYLVDSKYFKLALLVILQSCLANLKDLVNSTADELGVIFGNNLDCQEKQKCLMILIREKHC